MKLSYCPHCGSPIEVAKRKPKYNTQTGELKGYDLDLRCSNKWQRKKHPWIWWDYEEAKKERESTPQLIKEIER